MRVYEQLLNGEKALAVVGLGYVGMPLAIEFAKKIRVIGYDKSKEKINSYKKGIDATGEVSNEAIRNTTALFSDDDSVLADAAFYIVAVPTPIAEDKTPDLSSLVYASRDVGRHLKKGENVVFISLSSIVNILLTISSASMG
jgi:UDP-N-acetyl-D-galactosamine dehydrogenase